MTPDATLLEMLGSVLRIITFSAIALFAVAVLVVLWLCCTEHRSPDK